MVYRRVIGIIALTSLVGVSMAQDTVREIDKDRIREDAVADILRVPPVIVDIEPDLAVIRSINNRPIRIDQAKNLVKQRVGQIQVLSHRFAISSEQAMKLIADTFKYKVVRLDGKVLNESILLPSNEATISELLHAVEEAAGVRISIYQESEMIIVRKE